MSPAATPSSRSDLMTENEPAHTTTTARSEMCARAFTTPVNARGGCIVRCQRPAARDTSSVFQNLGAFVAVSVVVICTPGPDTALIIRNTLSGGRRGGIATATGIIGGIAVWTLAASAGAAALLSASEPVFRALQIAGAAYLVYLGLQSIVSALSRRPDRVLRGAGAPTLTPQRAFRQGFLSNLGNPKIAVFFVSLLPESSPTGASRSSRSPCSASRSR